MIEKLYSKYPIIALLGWLLLAFGSSFVLERSDFFLLEGFTSGIIYGVSFGILVILVSALFKLLFTSLFTSLRFSVSNTTLSRPYQAILERAVVIGFAEEFFFRIAIFGPLSRQNIYLGVAVCLFFETAIRFKSPLFYYLRQILITLLMTFVYLKHRSIVEVLVARFFIEMCFEQDRYLVNYLKHTCCRKKLRLSNIEEY